MDGLGGIIFWVFLGAVVLVPQILRHQERQRLHETIRASLAKGQPVPPELWGALRCRRRVYSGDYDVYPTGYAGQPYAPQGYAQPEPFDPAVAPAPAGEPGAFAPSPAAAPPPVFIGPSLHQRDLRRGVTWLAIGVGLIAAGGAFYAGLYYDGGAPEVFSSFAALGAIPLFVGLTYLALWRFGGKGRS